MNLRTFLSPSTMEGMFSVPTLLVNFPMIVSIENTCIASVAQSEFARLILDGVEVPLPKRAQILPGFVDTHCHLIGPGMMAERIDLRGSRSAEECVRLTGEEVRKRTSGEWVIGFGWNQEGWNDLQNFNRFALDRVAPQNPVALYRIDTHAVWVNSAGLKAAGLEGGGKIEGGEILINERGEPTGILIDSGVKLIEGSMPESTPEQIARWYRYGVEECLRYGITEVHDMTVHPDWLEPMTRIAESGDMKIRCQVFLDGVEERWKAVAKPTTLAPNLQTVGVKFFSDGALGSRGALLLEPYSDAPVTVGVEVMSAEEIVERSREPLAAGYGIATHAIGDGGNRLVLDAYAKLRPNYSDALLRIEHAQIVHPDDLSRFVALGVIPTVQPTHCTSDAKMAEARLGEERCTYAYGWKNLRNLGLPLLGGSDFPIESPDPLLGLRAFTVRQTESGAWHPEQTILREEALCAYTEWATLGVPTTPNRGRLQPGCDADLVVLDGDPFEEGTRVVMTVVKGRIQK